MNPALALGQTVHDVLDELSTLPQEDRFSVSLLDRLIEKWKKVNGKLGGFSSQEEEESYLARAKTMLERVMKNPGPLTGKAVKIRQELPYYWLSEDDNIILCGKIDWLEYIEETDSVRILDFKTGKFDEDGDSLQLPIYYLLVTNCQTRAIAGVRYWYLNRDDEPVDEALPRYDESEKRVLEIAKKIALARKLDRFVCKSKDGCPFCRPFESVIAGKATHIGVNDFNQDLYTI